MGGKVLNILDTLGPHHSCCHLNKSCITSSKYSKHNSDCFLLPTAKVLD